MHRHFIFAIVWGLLTISAAATRATVYHLTDIGTLGGSRSDATDINALGEVTGNSLTSLGYQHAFLYTGGKMREIPEFGFNSSGTASAFAINNAQHVVGTDQSYAYKYHQGAKSGLPAFYPEADGFFGSALDCNNDPTYPYPQIVGSAFLTHTSPTYHAFLYSSRSNVTTDLGTLGGTNSEARGINDTNQVVGSANLPGDAHHHAFLYNGGALIDLGTLGGLDSAANRISNNGDIVGVSNLPGNSIVHAFLYHNGVMSDLGTLGGTSSSAADINVHGQIVGSADTTNGVPHAFVYTAGVMRDLNTLLDASGNNWTLSTATGINDSGWIVGSGTTPAGQHHAFLLTPTTIPEPASGALTLCTFVFLLRRNYRAVARDRNLHSHNGSILD